MTWPEVATVAETLRLCFRAGLLVVCATVIPGLSGCITHPIVGLEALTGSEDSEEPLELALLGLGVAAAIGAGSVPLPGTGTPSYVDISAGQTDGENPIAAIDFVNQKLLVAAEMNLDRPGLFRSNLDGSDASFTDISAGLGLGTGSGSDPSIVIDTTNSKLLVITDEANNGDIGLIRCELDATGCIYRDLSGAAGILSLGSMEPSAAIDPINNRLLVAFEDTNSNRTAALLVCTLDGSSCSSEDISVGQGTDSGEFPEPLIDLVNQKVLVIAQNGDNDQKPSLYRCELDGTSCTHSDLSAGEGVNPANRPRPVLDTINSKLLVFGRNATTGSGLSGYRCELDGSGCTHFDLSTLAGDSGTGIALPFPAVDTVGGFVLIATRGPDSNRPHVYRCDLAFASCAVTDISAGQGANSGRSPTALIDTINSKLLVVTQNGANGDVPGLFIQ